jgi:hypothetical protein
MKRFRAMSRLSSQPELAESVVRRTWAPSALLVAATIAICILSYGLSMQVANERRDTEKLAQQNAALSSTLRSLDAELRVRMRLPQLQLWNDNVLGLLPISATQYLDNPLRLAAYATVQAEPALPQAQYAVRDLAPRASEAPGPQLHRVSAEAPAASSAPKPALRLAVAEEAVVPRQPEALRQTAVVRRPATAVAVAQPVSYPAPGRMGVREAVAAERAITRPQEAPADLLAQIEVAFAAPPGRTPEP